MHIFSQEGVPVLVSVAFWMTLLRGALGLGASLVRLIQRVADWGFVHGGDQLAEGLLATSGTMGGLAGTVSFMAVPFLWTETPQAWFRFHRNTRA